VDPANYYSTTLLNWMHVAQFVSACGAPVAMGAVARLSHVWFAPEQKAFATAIGTQANSLGVAMSFVMGPSLFPENRPSILAATALWIWLAVPATVVFLATLFAFPERPAVAPSESARIQRVESVNGDAEQILDAVAPAAPDDSGDAEHDAASPG
jgi:FLVCR family MFS transporter